jgi:hypothetical protein
VVAELRGQRPETVLAVSWYDDRTESTRSLEVPLWQQFPGVPAEEVERSVVLSVLEA